MKITRKASPEDLPQLVQLFDQYRVWYHKPSDISEAENFLKERMQNKESVIFVSEENGTLTGFTQLYPIFSSTRMKRYWLLNDLFVNENYRGKGHSKQLIKEAKTLCRETKACGVLLETDKTNTIGNQLYPSCGFDAYTHANFYEWSNPDS